MLPKMVQMPAWLPPVVHLQQHRPKQGDINPTDLYASSTGEGFTQHS